MGDQQIRDRIIGNVEKVIAAPSCCAELREIAQKWIDALGTEKEKELSAQLVAELEEDVSTLDHVIPFFESETGVQIFGAEGAAAQAAAARKAKEEGGIYCLCPACQAGAAVLADKEYLL